MSESTNQYTAEFKQDAVNYYYKSGKSIKAVAKDLGCSDVSIGTWLKKAKVSGGVVEHRGSGNYASEDAKEIARLKRELQNYKDALEVLKKAISILND